jgi:hypothetical protein
VPTIAVGGAGVRRGWQAADTAPPKPKPKRVAMNTSLPRLRSALLVLALLGLGVVAVFAVPGRFGLVPAASTSAATDATGQATPTATQTATPTATHTAAPSATSTAAAGGEDESSDGDEDTSDGNEDGGDGGPVLDSADDPTAKVGPAKGRNTDTVDSPPSDENVDYSLFGGDQRTIRFHNGSSKTVSVAVLMYDPDKCGGEGKNYRSAGWYNLAPGETRSVMKTSNAFGYYAVSADGRYVWPSQRQGGNTRVYVYQSAFDSCLGIASTDGFVVNMKSIRASSGSGTYTLNLNPPA